MVKTLAIKFLFKQITKILERRYNLKKMHDYVVKPNELDKQVKQIQKTLSKHGKYIESIVLSSKLPSTVPNIKPGAASISEV